MFDEPPLLDVFDDDPKPDRLEFEVFEVFDEFEVVVVVAVSVEVVSLAAAELAATKPTVTAPVAKVAPASIPATVRRVLLTAGLVDIGDAPGD